MFRKSTMTWTMEIAMKKKMRMPRMVKKDTLTMLSQTH